MPDRCEMGSGHGSGSIKGWDRPKQYWVNVLKGDMDVCGVERDLALDRREWRKETHCDHTGNAG